MRAIKIIILLLITLYIGFSCESATYNEISGEVENPTFTANVKSIIDSNCIACHSPAGRQFPTLVTFTQVRASAESGDLICRIDDQSCGAVMPQSGRMPQASINTIKKWAANGYPN